MRDVASPIPQFTTSLCNHIQRRRRSRSSLVERQILVSVSIQVLPIGADSLKS
ncbi:hypothetical protein A2U01_0041122, partial [Trifolium medium]|nr:hypothetical protein [Trifolium medium]